VSFNTKPSAPASSACCANAALPSIVTTTISVPGHLFAQAADRVDPRTVRHLQIQDEHVGSVAANAAYDGRELAGLCDHPDALLPVQHHPQAPAHLRVVVGDDHADRALGRRAGRPSSELKVHGHSVAVTRAARAGDRGKAPINRGKHRS